MRHYDSINRIQDDGFLIGKPVWAFNKLDGQNLAVKYNPKKDIFDMFGSRNRVLAIRKMHYNLHDLINLTWEDEEWANDIICSYDEPHGDVIYNCK